MKSTIHEHQENNFKIVSKKTIIFAGLALVAFANVSLASNVPTVTTSTEIVNYDNTPLCSAIMKGDLATVKKFIEYGSNVNEPSNGLTPLMFVCSFF